jgi:hypothetical protein
MFDFTGKKRTGSARRSWYRLSIVQREVPGERSMKTAHSLKILTAIFFFLSAHVSSGSEMIIENLEKVSHKVVYVNAFGNWAENDMNGYYRVILLDAEADFPHSKIYLQWIAKHEKKDDQVVASASVIEINNVGVFKLSVPKISKSKDGNSIEVTAVNQYSHGVQSLLISPGSLESYELDYISQPYSEIVDSAVKQIPMSLDYYVRPTF